ncbi:MAG TPA: UDP-phosphate galactose phosphotransferase [Cyanobacteria bacterium UBA11149]|nr:UDP-phosphate galactose phosphotransferase [Cyanobacteria bacterium UBA11367]HBE56173.1 UDP-phosphate galactose phosphotransferase [Cyanobacteria bacterium UBA11366]HBK62194.1 UDP-phosphate galactose phosphotransferase [Cyanobacteria bacterium UBA11166]HBR73897.1 UDP-phosphate galactose phosphotransferase [Cyanobacteria bacterium UBA11159]HBS70218.1 UDP-phosphate galactose phosphotransferase [Cyanobacteria bacterium UBA11153]HBW90851.1 UDP-phosphate galactose phosphotransferase [Cyanobacter
MTMKDLVASTEDITPEVFLRQIDISSPKKQASHLKNYSIKWRQNNLLVRRNQSKEQLYIPALENQEKLIQCLKISPVKLISLDLGLGETEIRFWADACEKAGKKVSLKIPAKSNLKKKHHPLTWYLKLAIDWTIAAIFFVVLSPLMLGLAFAIAISSDSPIFFQQWRVGKRGKLFRILKFRTMVVEAEKLHHQVMNYLPGLYKQENDPLITPLGRWMRKYNLDELPQLINVLRGEMSLVGSRPCTIYNAVGLSLEGQRQLNLKPGMIGSQVRSGVSVVDLEADSQGTAI